MEIKRFALFPGCRADYIKQMNKNTDDFYKVMEIYREAIIQRLVNNIKSLETWFETFYY